MNAHDFEKLFTDVHEEAVRIVARKFSAPRDTLATDAVQSAAAYCLERLPRFETITRSYFIQLAMNRARDILKAERRQHARVRPVGSTRAEGGLALVERSEVRRGTGRTSPKRRLSQIEGDERGDD